METGSRQATHLTHLECMYVTAPHVLALFPSLVQLNILCGDGSEFQHPATVRVLRHMRALAILKLRHVGLTNDGIRELAATLQESRAPLRQLNLAHNNDVTDVTPLGSAVASTLTWLRLPITVTTAAALPRLPLLHTLFCHKGVNATPFGSPHLSIHAVDT